jgi:CheY-like chemotaxis protein
MERARILAVDGDPLVRRLVEIVLTSDGFDVDLAADGREARMHVRARRPDLVLANIEKPVDPVKLRTAVRTLIAARRAQGARISPEAG